MNENSDLDFYENPSAGLSLALLILLNGLELIFISIRENPKNERKD